MALAACDWEIRTDGDDANGGGFERGAPAENDRSQQAAAYWADSLSHGDATDKVEPANHTVDSADVGNLVCIQAETDWTAGWYAIRSIDTAGGNNYWVLDRAAHAGTPVSSTMAKMGGALASIGGFGYIMAMDANHRASGLTDRTNVHWRSGLYVLGSASYNVPGGAYTEDADWSIHTHIAGYDSASGRYPAAGWDSAQPIFRAGAYNPGTNGMLFRSGYGTTLSSHWRNIEVDCSDGAGNRVASTGIRGQDARYLHTERCVVHHASATGNNGGFMYLRATRCLAHECAGYGFYACNAVHSVAHHNANGFCEGYTSSGQVACLAYANTGVGFWRAYDYRGCISYGNGGAGFSQVPDRQGVYAHCVSAANNYGFVQADARSAYHSCWAYGNTSGVRSVTAVPLIDEIESLTANPFLCPVSATSVSYTAATKTLTKAGAFSGIDNTHPTGYRIRITGGTNMTPGTYWVASKVSDDAVVLATDAGTDDSVDAESDYDFNLNNVEGGGKTLREAGFELEI